MSESKQKVKVTLNLSTMPSSNVLEDNRGSIGLGLSVDQLTMIGFGWFFELDEFQINTSGAETFLRGRGTTKSLSN